MSDKQLAILKKYLSDEDIKDIEGKGPQAVSNFVNLIIQLKQPNRWNNWISERLEDDDRPEVIDYGTLIALDIYDIFTFIQFIAE
jgi:hypothetical protein